MQMSIIVEPDLFKSIRLLGFLDPHQFDIIQIAGH